MQRLKRMRREIGANMGDIVSDLGEFRVKFFIFFLCTFQTLFFIVEGETRACVLTFESGTPGDDQFVMRYGMPRKCGLVTCRKHGWAHWVFELGHWGMSMLALFTIFFFKD